MKSTTMISKFYKGIQFAALGLMGSLIMSSCAEKSSTTGWDYNDSKNGGFEVNTGYEGQQTGPGLVFVEGGTFTMGRAEDDIMRDWNNIPRRVTVSSFYMDETEVTNLAYREYIYWLDRVYGFDYPEVVQNALPDTLVWRSRLGYNDPYVETYFRHPAYQFYPVVGVSWKQANDYCAWRTDRVNEQILIEEGVLRTNPNQYADDNFDTDAYLFGFYTGEVKKNLPDLNPNGLGEAGRPVNLADGILLPRYRLPTEAEWEYAALALIGNTEFERVTEKRQYPWNSSSLRNPDERNKGFMLANYKRGRGDMMGIAGSLNDSYDITAPVKSFPPNDFGLYDMAGNVAEWVLDVYRPLTGEDVDDFRAFRGNVFSTWATDEDGYVEYPDSLGNMIRREVTAEEALGRRNYDRAENRDYVDGDLKSSIYYDKGELPEGDDPMYEYAKKTMVNNEVRVYKGGSWKDRAYWLVPGNRRYLEEDMSTDFIGFRCAMHRVGSQTNN